MTEPNATTRTILLVEDDPLIGHDLKRILVKGGHAVGGPFAEVADARGFLNGTGIDAAVLDVNLGDGRTSLDLARELRARGTPFVFLTGYAVQENHFEGDLMDVPRLGKPTRPSELAEAVGRLLEG